MSYFLKCFKIFLIFVCLLANKQCVFSQPEVADVSADDALINFSLNIEQSDGGVVEGNQVAVSINGDVPNDCGCEDCNCQGKLK